MASTVRERIVYMLLYGKADDLIKTGGHLVFTYSNIKDYIHHSTILSYAHNNGYLNIFHGIFVMDWYWVTVVFSRQI